MDLDPQINKLVESINDKGVFKVSFEWMLDTQASEAGTIIGLVTGGWAGKAHTFELGTEDNEFLDGVLNVLDALSGLKELN